jgi:hypothetical protein
LVESSHTGREISEEEWKFQLRIQLTDEMARKARNSEEFQALQPLYDLIARYEAELVCQYDAFAGYCKQAERLGEQNLPLYKWTKATIENPEKEAKYIKIFTIYVRGEEVYDQEIAEKLEVELKPMVGGPVVEKLSKYDSNPANNPQPPKKYLD